MDIEKCFLSPIVLYPTTKRSFYFFSDHGKIIKTVNAESADSNKKVSSVVIEELDVLPTNEPIRNLEIIRTTQYGRFCIKRYKSGTKTIESITGACQQHMGNGNNCSKLGSSD